MVLWLVDPDVPVRVKLYVPAGVPPPLPESPLLLDILLVHPEMMAIPINATRRTYVPKRRLPALRPESAPSTTTAHSAATNRMKSTVGAPGGDLDVPKGVDDDAGVVVRFTFTCDPLVPLSVTEVDAGEQVTVAGAPMQPSETV